MSRLTTRKGRGRSMPRSRRPKRCPRRGGSSDSSKARRSDRWRHFSRRCAAWFTRGPRRRRRATVSKPSWQSPTVHWCRRRLAVAVLAPADGVLVTSATLRGGEDWAAADARTGALHLPGVAGHFEAESPFDYAGCSEVLIVTDVKQGDIASLAGAYARLIAAAKGGTLGLFTAIQRLKAVHARIADRLARDGLPLLAQHVDPIDAGTLVDIFRDDPRASLLGTDALRDGVDVPGESLRLVVMERVPWPRPTVLHAARRMAGGGSAYDDRVVRARLAQAFGRLIRRQSDCGMFVIMSAAMPSRLLTAFPPGVN